MTKENLRKGLGILAGLIYIAWIVVLLLATPIDFPQVMFALVFGLIMGLAFGKTIVAKNQSQPGEGMEIVAGRTRKFQSCEQAYKTAVTLAEKESLNRRKLGIK